MCINSFKIKQLTKGGVTAAHKIKKKGAVTMFKKIVEEIAKGTPIDEVCGMIDRAYQNDKFSWKDHETLYALIGRIDK